MKFLGETNCLVFGGMKPQELTAYTAKFGSKNLTGLTLVIHLPDLDKATFEAHEKFFGKNLKRTQFVIASA